MNLIKSL